LEIGEYVFLFCIDGFPVIIYPIFSSWISGGNSPVFLLGFTGGNPTVDFFALPVIIQLFFWALPVALPIRIHLFFLLRFTGGI
jgi:hypothetical protein